MCSEKTAWQDYYFYFFLLSAHFSRRRIRGTKHNIKDGNVKLHGLFFLKRSLTYDLYLEPGFPLLSEAFVKWVVPAFATFFATVDFASQKLGRKFANGDQLTPGLCPPLDKYIASCQSVWTLIVQPLQGLPQRS